MDLTISGRHYRQAIVGKEDFGEERLEFALRWNVDGHPRSKKELIDPAKKWTLYMVPHIHLDVGYTDYQAKVAAIQSRVIDEALEITGKHPDFRFSLDGEWSLEQFLKTRTPAEQKAAITAIQNEHLFVPAQYASLLTGFPTAETLIQRQLQPRAWNTL